jgi:hypothetical protein
MQTNFKQLQNDFLFITYIEASESSNKYFPYKNLPSHISLEKHIFIRALNKEIT